MHAVNPDAMLGEQRDHLVAARVLEAQRDAAVRAQLPRPGHEPGSVTVPLQHGLRANRVVGGEEADQTIHRCVVTSTGH
jgi:hypothetical protein